MGGNATKFFQACHLRSERTRHFTTPKEQTPVLLNIQENSGFPFDADILYEVYKPEKSLCCSQPQVYGFTASTMCEDLQDQSQ